MYQSTIYQTNNMEECTQHVLFLKKNFHFFFFSLKMNNVKKAKKKPLRFFERIFRFAWDIVDILDKFRYSSSSESVNYHFLASSEMMIQISSPLGVQGFYHQKEKRNLWVRWYYTSVLSCFELKFVIQVLYISLLKRSSSFLHSGHNFTVIFGAKFPQIIVVLPLKRVQLSPKTLVLLSMQYSTRQAPWKPLIKSIERNWMFWKDNFHIWIRSNVI